MSELTVLQAYSEEEFIKKAEEAARLLIRRILETEGECRLGLAGGFTPKFLYESLATWPLPWEKIKIIQLDERYVPSDNEQSNVRMLRETLLNKVSPQNVLSFDTSLSYESAAQDMDRRLVALKQAGRPLLDLLILGAGADGHIASLFEGEAALHSPNYASTAMAKNAPVSQRLTLTLKALEEAPATLLLLKGTEKEPVLTALTKNLHTSSVPPCTALKKLLQKTKCTLISYLPNASV